MFLFPSEYTCLKMSWFDKEFLDLRSNIELINKSFSFANNEISQDDYLLNFNWVPYWFERNYQEILEHLITMFLPIIIFILFLSNDTLNDTVKYNYYIFILFIFCGLIFWFALSPVFRFSIPFFLFLAFVVTLNIFIKIF